MKHKKTAIIACISALIPIVIGGFLFRFIAQQVAIMGEDQRISKTNAYTALADIAPQQATIFFGDSITELCPIQEIYADYIEETGIAMLNRGISAETTETMLERIEENVLILKPRNLVMLMGVNDLAENTSYDEIVNNIQKMIQLTKQKSPQTNIILQAVYPINVSDRTSFYQQFQIGDRSNDEINELNEKLEQMAQEENITFLNVNHLLTDEKQELKAEYTADGLHPTIEGYLAVKDEIIQVLK